MSVATIVKQRRPIGTANSRRCLKAWLAGMKTPQGIAMMLGVHGGEEVGGGFVLEQVSVLTF